MAPNPIDQEWRCIAEQASKETDPVKLTALVAQLCRAFDDRGKKPPFLKPPSQNV
jgi:hypothetical protein